MFKVELTTAPKDFSFYQQEKGYAGVELKGKFYIEDYEPTALPYAKVVDEKSGVTVIGCTPFKTEGDNCSVTFKIPAGYSYTIHICIFRKDWFAYRFYEDYIHHIGVGDIFIIAGQSNAQGNGFGEYENLIHNGIYNFKYCESWALADHPLNWLDRSIKFGQGIYGPHIRTAKDLVNQTGIPVGFVSCAVGGVPIKRWNKHLGGDLYEGMLSYVKKAGGKVAGVIWYQGCDDALKEETAKAYYENFAQMVQDFRDDLGIKDLPFFTYQLNTLHNNEGYSDGPFSLMREQQRRAAQDLKNVYIVPTFGAAKSDNAHNSVEGCNLIGRRMARLIMSVLYKKYEMPVIPNVQKVTKSGKNKIKVQFQKGVILTAGELPSGKVEITVFDQKGINNYKEYKLHKNTITLTLERAVEGEATVHGCYGKAPSGLILRDFSYNMPILGFSTKL